MLRLKLFAISVVCLSSFSVAFADTPRGTYIPIDETMADIRKPGVEPTSHGGHTLYVNPCWGGETFTSGYNDSRNNRSSIISGSRNLPQYPWGESSFQQVMTCVREIMSPFNIEVTDTDPGSTPHHEAVVCGHPNDIGMQSGVGGVAPFSCGVIENSITYTFPEIYGGNTRAICETIAQEAAHAWGLDHERLCTDPMTYLNGCGPKTYQNMDARCGEFSDRNCQCGGATQNSYQKILAVFGASEPTPPDVTITEPLPNAAVQGGFVVRADIEDPDGLSETRLYVDGELAMTVTTEPYGVFNAPSNLADGDHQIEVRAVDAFGAEGKDTMYVIVGEPCAGNNDCEDGEACVDGRCVVGPGTPGGLGEDCDTGSDCASGVCGSDGTDSVCTEPCDLEADGCPGGFECVNAGGGGVCWPGGGDGGGCAVALLRTGGQAPWGALLLVAGVFIAVFRRPRRSSSACR